MSQESSRQLTQVNVSSFSSGEADRMDKEQTPSPTDQPPASTSRQRSAPSIAGETVAARGDDENQIGEPFHRFQELKAADFAAAVRCFSQFKTGLLRRMEWEDAHLFPAFSERVGGGVEDACATLRQEHEMIREMLNVIELKLSQGNSATEPEEQAVVAALIAHNHREHRVFYSALEG